MPELEPQKMAGQPVAASRKVIDRVHLELQVTSLSTLQSQLTAAVAAASGYIASSHLETAQFQGRWTLRIPTPQLPALLTDSHTWGTLLSQQSAAEDVTDQFIDVTARVVTKRLEEQRLQQLLSEHTGDLSEVLTVERELSRVRGEIEQSEGRQRFLEHATSFATVELQATELQPPLQATPVVPIPFARQLLSVLQQSWSLLLAVLRACLLALAAMLPWLGASLIPISLMWWSRRRFQSAPANPIFK